jgi:hypothetical protein
MTIRQHPYSRRLGKKGLSIFTAEYPSTVLSKDQTLSLFKEAMTLLVEGGIRIDEMARVAGCEVPAIEVKSTKPDEESR